MTETIEALLFEDHKGNVMFFPSLAIWSEEPEPRSRYDISCEGFTISQFVGIKNKGWRTFDAENLPHVKGDIGSHMFEHGRATVYILEGPDFDEAMREYHDSSN